MGKIIGKRSLAVFLAVLMIGSVFSEYPVSARVSKAAQNIAANETGGQTVAEDTENSQEQISISVTINGVDINSVETIHQGDEIQISINWILGNQQTGKEQPDGSLTETCVVNLNPARNVHIPDIDYKELKDPTGKVIGYATVKNNTVTMVITDKEFLRKEKNRGAKGTIKGKIDAGDEKHKSGDEVLVDLGEAGNWTLIWDNKEQESWLDVRKQAENIVFDKANNKWVQTYTIYISSYNGESTIEEIKDVPGSGLSNMSSITVKSNMEDSNLDKSSLSSLSELKNLTLKAGEVLTLTYTMDIAASGENGDSVFSSSEDSLKNTVSGTWKNNKQVGGKKFSSDAKANLIPPTVKKTIAAGSTDEEQVWEIVINLGDAKQLGMSFDDVVKSVIDELGEGLESIGNTLKPSDFVEQPDGTYKATFKTTLKAGYKNSESTTVYNTVTVTTPFGEITDKGSYTTKGIGGASISKTADGKYDSETGRISWTVVLSDIPANATDVKVSEDTQGADWKWSGGSNGKTWGVHDLPTTLKVNGTIVIKNNVVTEVGKSILRTKWPWNTDIDYSSLKDIYFLDTYISSMAGKDITLTYETEVADKNASMKNVLFYNQAALSYKTAKGDYKYLTDDAVYENENAVEDALSKTGAVNEEADTITYTLRVDLDELKLEDKGNIVITDELPEGLVYVDGSAGIADRFGDWNLTQDKDTYYYPAGKTFWRWWHDDEKVRKNSKLVSEYRATVSTAATKYEADTNQVLTFTIPVDEYFAVKKLYGEQYQAGKVYNLAITYVTRVADAEEFVKAGETRQYTNRATGSYNGNSLGKPAVATNQLTPNNMVKKDAVFYPENIKGESNTVEFTVYVNPGAYDLSSGKLEAVDTLGMDLSYDLTSIKVYEVGEDDSETELTVGMGEDQYSFAYNPFNNSLTFTLPDSKHLKITYVAKATAVVKAGDKIEIRNSFALKGYDKDNMQDSVAKNVIAVEDNWRGYSDIGAIKLRKYWSDGGKMKAVIGSEFKVYKAELTADKKHLTPLLNEPVNPEIKYEITAENVEEGGKYSELVIDGLKYNEYYALIEIKGGADLNDVPMATNGDPYFFIIEGSDKKEAELPEGCKKFALGGTEDYPNEKSDGEKGVIKIVKKWEETEKSHKLDWEKIKGHLRFEISNNDIENPLNISCSGINLIWNGKDRYERQFQLPLGTYTVTEFNDIDDYVVTTSYTVTGSITREGNGTDVDSVTIGSIEDSVTITYTNVYDYVGTFPVTVSKVDITNSEEIPGAILTITGHPDDGSEFKPITWTSGKDGYIEGDERGRLKPHMIDLKAGDYTLEEKTAPGGYVIAQSIPFRVESDGKIYINGSENPNTVVVMTDDDMDIQVSKREITEAGITRELSGAKLAVYHKEDINKDGNPIKGRNSVMEWVSDGTAHDIGGRLEGGKTYVLVEIAAPEGYYRSPNIEFTVKSDGTIDVKDGTETEATTTEKHTVGNHIIMYDETISLKLAKVNRGGEVLSGAEIGLYNASDVDDKDGRPKEGTEPIRSWTSGPEPFEFGDLLEVGKEYFLVEIEAPEGYKLADSIYIKVLEDGSINAEEAEIKDGVIQMVDLTADEEKDLATLVIQKTVGGVLTPDEINGALKFHVKSTAGVSPAYDRTFTISKNFRKVGDTYVLRLNDLTPGTYTVKELIEGTTPYDMICTSTYTIKTDPAVNGDAEDPATIDLSAGDVVTVEYNNFYEYRFGKLKVTKTFTEPDGKLTWEDIAPKLTFHIYDAEDPEKNDIKGSPINGTDLKWNGTVYESDELEVKIGNYTVVEEYDSDGCAVETTVKVSGISGLINGTTAIAEVKENNTTTVDYKNDYHVIEVKLSKVDLDGGTELAGADINVYEREDVNANGSVKAGAKSVAYWKSDGKGPHDFGPELTAGKKYVFVETAAPQGYLITTNIYFEIDEDGGVTVEKAVNDNYIIVDGVIKMQDKVSPNKDSLSSLVLTKTLEGISYQDIDGKLSFKVESVSLDVNPKYKKTFIVGVDGFDWDPVSKRYVKEITNLQRGTYKVTEVIGNSTPDGLICKKQSYSVDTSPAIMGSNTSIGNDLITDGFPLKKTELTVAFDNVYTQSQVEEGTLIIKKTIKGPVTKEEAEGSLQFKVTNRDTKKSVIYTLKDFDYDEDTKVWTKELDAVVGGYTVEESTVNPIKGYKLTTVKYAVNGGNPLTGKAPKVDVIANRESTVQFENTYKKSSGKSSGGGGGDDDAPTIVRVANAVVTSLTQTGDGAPLGIWLLLLVCGGAGVIASAIVLKRRRKRD